MKNSTCAGPGTTYLSIGKLDKGKSAEIVGRSADGKWWQIAYPTADKRGWVAVEFTTVTGATNALPVVQVTPPPTKVAAATSVPTKPAGIDITMLQGKIVYASWNTVYLMNANGTDIHPVAAGQAASLSFDGTKLAYVGPETGEDKGIWILDLATGQLTQVLNERFEFFFGGLGISPDGNRVVYSDKMWERGRNHPFPCGWSAAWSPDSGWIACVGFFSGQSGIYKVLAEGGNLILLAKDGRSPAWSPDSTKIVFAKGQCCIKNQEIWVMNSDGTDAHQLANADNGGSSPVWSPDGQYIAFISVRDRWSDLYVMKADGTSPTRLTNTKEAKVGSPNTAAGLSWSK
jgi:dipeptidyl aminopeptidase/acylaminoacyl peptidase